MNLFTLIVLVILIVLSCYLLANIITHFFKLQILKKSINESHKLVQEDLKNNKEHIHNIILNNNVSSAINSARDSMKGIKNE